MAEQAIRLTVKTLVGAYDVTLTVDQARAVLVRFGLQVSAKDLEPEKVANYLMVVWLSNAMKADAGVAGTDVAPYLNYQADGGEMVSVRSTAVMAVESRMVPLEKGMGFGSITAELMEGLPTEHGNVVPLKPTR